MYIPMYEIIPTERGYKSVLIDENGRFEFEIPVGTTEEPAYEVFNDEEDVMLEDGMEEDYEVVSLVNNSYGTMYEIMFTGTYWRCEEFSNGLWALGFKDDEYIIRRSCEI